MTKKTLIIVLSIVAAIAIAVGVTLAVLLTRKPETPPSAGDSTIYQTTGFGPGGRADLFGRAGGRGAGDLYHVFPVQDRREAEPEMCGEEPAAGPGKV